MRSQHCDDHSCDGCRDVFHDCSPFLLVTMTTFNHQLSALNACFRGRELIAGSRQLLFGERGGDGRSGYGDVLILLRGFSADADRPDDFSIDDDGHTTLQRHGSM